MDRDWKRLGRAIKAQREHLGMATQQDLANNAGVTRQTVQSLEAGTERKRTPPTIGKVEKALGWEPGTATRILSEAAPEAAPRFAEGMPLRVARELSEGQVEDTEVLDLTLPGSKSRLVVVFKHDSEAADMAPDELRAALQEWTRIQRALRQITAGDEADEA
ncbi:helix-turn-helix domain-containing protein [Streptomyces sp. NBC_01214]|uniref:helix-turn-helix transcriptional regulator n=1 Tax=Streptomyces sp. NBC_01214 TaxID=2903777 RepID=UPI00225312FF|nr:helix-turn-helix transcriptional regulator [Streptomyces sp. NBC_01214]MCX4801716.1 helix-turn-helix domain-containing protein [Streptomyces sp. NBC_01214]